MQRAKVSHILLDLRDHYLHGTTAYYIPLIACVVGELVPLYIASREILLKVWQ